MNRLSQNDSLLHQQERMAALGTLSAGLAHELNNPAAAAQRSAAELQKTVVKWQALTHEIESVAFKENQTDWLNQFMQDATRRFESRVKLEALEKIDLVDQLQSWLEAGGIESAWVDDRVAERVEGIRSFQIIRSMAWRKLFDDGVAFGSAIDRRARFGDRARNEVVHLSRSGAVARSGRA
jgi:signal transduction histidine kinase